MAVTVNWLQSINWIPVEERLPDVSVDEHLEVTYVTYEDLTDGKRYVADNIGFELSGEKRSGYEYKWVVYDEDDYDTIYGEEWHPFEDENCRVVAWSKDTVDILPY